MCVEKEPKRDVALFVFQRVHNDGAFDIGTHFLLMAFLFTVFMTLYAVQKQLLRDKCLRGSFSHCLVLTGKCGVTCFFCRNNYFQPALDFVGIPCTLI